MAKDHKKLKVSILIPLYNSENYIAETIESAVAQSWDNKEIIIVDDGSTDRSYEIAKSYESDIVKVFTQENKGGSAARNTAFKLSNGDYIQYLDADDILPPDKINAQLSILQKHQYDPGVLTFCRFVTLENNFNEVWENTFPIYNDYTEPLELLADFWIKRSYVIPLAWLCHRDLIIKAGPWNECISLNDDGEFFSRVIKQAIQIAFCENCFVYYRHTPNSVSKRKDRKSMMSWVDSINLISILLLNSGNKDAVEASSIAYSRFMYNWYPGNKFILSELKTQMKEKGLSFVIPIEKNSRFYAILSQLFGWKGAKTIIEFSKHIVPGKIKNQIRKLR